MVIWSEMARDDLRAIFKYIELDSKFYANKVVHEIIEQASTLNNLPAQGRIVPELNDTSIREIFVYSYRVMYQISSEKIEVLTVVHGRRELSSKDILLSEH